jgi:hypothetical protein
MGMGSLIRSPVSQYRIAGPTPILDHNSTGEFPRTAQLVGRREHGFLTVPGDDPGIEGFL